MSKSSVDREQVRERAREIMRTHILNRAISLSQITQIVDANEWPEMAGMKKWEIASYVEDIFDACWTANPVFEWPDVAVSNGSDDELDEILGDAMVGDEYEDGDGYSRNGLRRVVDDTDIPEKLIAWRDAAVKAALAQAVQQIRDNPMWATATSRDNATDAAEWFAGLIGDSKS